MKRGRTREERREGKGHDEIFVWAMTGPFKISLFFSCSPSVSVALSHLLLSVGHISTE
jgi:hypothetical protein